MRVFLFINILSRFPSYASLFTFTNGITVMFRLARSLNSSTLLYIPRSREEYVCIKMYLYSRALRIRAYTSVEAKNTWLCTHAPAYYLSPERVFYSTTGIPILF